MRKENARETDDAAVKDLKTGASQVGCKALRNSRAVTPESKGRVGRGPALGSAASDQMNTKNRTLT